MSLEYLKKALNGDSVVQKMVQKVVGNNNIETIIETGTHVGYSTYFFSKLVKNVITTEINAEWLNKAKDYLKNLTNIQFFMGDSADILSKELHKFDYKNVFFFLDAHFNNDLALDRELNIIAKSNVVPYIMIHDFKVPNRKDLGYDKWDCKEYSFPNIEHMIKEIYPSGYKIYYNHESERGQRGCVIIEPLIIEN